MKTDKDMLGRFKNYNIECFPGVIIGEAKLVDCILVDKEFNEELRCIDSIVYGKSNHVKRYA